MPGHNGIYSAQRQTERSNIKRSVASVPWYKQFTPPKRTLILLVPCLAEKPEAGGGRIKRTHAYTIIRDEENCDSFGYYPPYTTNKAAEDGERRVRLNATRVLSSRIYLYRHEQRAYE